MGMSLHSMKRLERQPFMIIKLQQLQPNKWAVYEFNERDRTINLIEKLDGSIDEIGQKLAKERQQKIMLMPGWEPKFYCGKPRFWLFDLFRNAGNGGIL
jgi:hypothetical protein